MDGRGFDETPYNGATPEQEELEDRAYETVGFQEFAPTVKSVAEARRFVGEVLERFTVNADQRFACQLVADELATNALCHAGSYYSVAVELSGAHIRICVRDDSRSLPEIRITHLDSIRGRGLLVVAHTAEAWGSESLGLGKETWADVHQTSIEE